MSASPLPALAPPSFIAMRLSLLLLLLVPVLAGAQAPIHLTARGTAASSGSFDDPVGLAAQLDITASPRVDVRFGYLLSRGSGALDVACPRDPGLCASRRVPREQTVHSASFAVPVRLGQAGPVEFRFVLGVRLDRAQRRYGIDPLGEPFPPDARTTFGGEGGLEARWYLLEDGRLQLVGGLDLGSASGVAETFRDSQLEPNAGLARLSIGARLRLRPTRP